MRWVLGGGTRASSEVQRPLATVVIFGIVGATVLMLVVFPGIMRMLMVERRKPMRDESVAAAREADTAPPPLAQ